MSGPLRAAATSVLAAALLIAIKLSAGLASGSLALIAEAVHSGTDLAAALLTFAVLRIAIRPPDREHQYGHAKAEHLAALAEGTFLMLVSIGVAALAIRRLAGHGNAEVETSVWLFAVLALVIAIDLARVVALRRAAAEHHSAALEASALHFASDMAGSLAVVIGLVLVAAGWHDADSIAALVVAVLVVTAAARLISQNANVLMDRAPAGVEDRVRRAVYAAEPGVALRRVRTRTAGGRYFVETVAGYRADAGLGESHAAADAIEQAIVAALPGADVVVHVEPTAESHDLRARASAAALTVRGVREVHDVRVIDVDGRPELSLHLKLPPTTALEDAHVIATAVEAEIAGAVPELADVHTHLEPLAPLAASAEPSDAETAGAAAVIDRIVHDRTGAAPRRLSFRAGDNGIVVLLTVALAGDLSLDEAHGAASALEAEVRGSVPSVGAVIVHTEPDSATAG